MMTTESTDRPASLGRLLGVAWRRGGPSERFFVAMIYAAVPLVILILWSLAIGSVTGLLMPYETGVVVIWGFLIGFFQQAMLRPIYSPAALRELARVSSGPIAPENLRELARYLEANSENGHLPGEIALGLAHWIAFYGILLVGIVLTVVLEPTLGIWILLVYPALVVPVCFALWRGYRRRVSRFYDEMEKEGYRVRSHGRRVRHASVTGDLVE